MNTENVKVDEYIKKIYQSLVNASALADNQNKNNSYNYRLFIGLLKREISELINTYYKTVGKDLSFDENEGFTDALNKIDESIKAASSISQDTDPLSSQLFDMIHEQYQFLLKCNIPLIRHNLEPDVEKQLAAGNEIDPEVDEKIVNENISAIGSAIGCMCKSIEDGQEHTFAEKLLERYESLVYNYCLANGHGYNFPMFIYVDKKVNSFEEGLKMIDEALETAKKDGKGSKLYSELIKNFENIYRFLLKCNNQPARTNGVREETKNEEKTVTMEDVPVIPEQTNIQPEIVVPVVPESSPVVDIPTMPKGPSMPVVEPFQAAPVDSIPVMPDIPTAPVIEQAPVAPTVVEEVPGVSTSGETVSHEETGKTSEEDELLGLIDKRYQEMGSQTSKMPGTKVVAKRTWTRKSNRLDGLKAMLYTAIKNRSSEYQKIYLNMVNFRAKYTRLTPEQRNGTLNGIRQAIVAATSLAENEKSLLTGKYEVLAKTVQELNVKSQASTLKREML